MELDDPIPSSLRLSLRNYPQYLKKCPITYIKALSTHPISHPLVAALISAGLWRIVTSPSFPLDVRQRSGPINFAFWAPRFLTRLSVRWGALPRHHRRCCAVVSVILDDSVGDHSRSIWCDTRLSYGGSQCVAVCAISRVQQLVNDR